MKYTNAYQNAIETNQISSEQAKKEVVSKQTLLGKEGCQKLSFLMLKEMGITGVSKMEMNFLIYLASVQDSNGIAVTNVHMTCTEIGCAYSSFTELLHKLEKKDLIQIKRSKDWKECKLGIYYIDLVHNHFTKDFKDTPYIRLNHGIFRTKKFYSLTPAAKYVVLKGMFTLNESKKSEMKDLVNMPFFLELKPLKQETMEWNGCASRTFDYAVHSVMSNYNGEIEVWGKNGQKRANKGIVLKFTEKELVFNSSDSFSRASNLISASCEEEGLHLCEEVHDSKQLAEILFRNKKKAETLVAEAKENYQVGMSILNTAMPKTKEEWDRVNELTEDFYSIVKSTNVYQEKFAFLKPGKLCAWGNRRLKGSLIKDENIPLWLRYIIGKTVTAYQAVKTSILIRKWNLKEFNLLSLIEEFLHAFLYKKKLSSNTITKILLSNKLEVSA